MLRTALLLLSVTSCVLAQGPPATRTPKASAPFDLTGYWVSIVTEDWRFRMVVPPKGDVASLPLNAEARRIANAWDPAKEEPDSCKAYGAAAIMRVPGRLHVTWEGETAYKMDLDAGTQTRMLRFGAAPPAGETTWQGNSVATWEGLAGPGRGGTAPAPRGSLKVVTTNIKAGYLRKNGVPYSDKAVLTENYDIVTEPNGVQWLIVQSILEDPTYLTGPFVTSTNFRRQADSTGWSPSPCSSK